MPSIPIDHRSYHKRANQSVSPNNEGAETTEGVPPVTGSDYLDQQLYSLIPELINWQQLERQKLGRIIILFLFEMDVKHLFQTFCDLGQAVLDFLINLKCIVEANAFRTLTEIDQYFNAFFNTPLCALEDLD